MTIMKPQTLDTAVLIPLQECLYEHDLDFTADGRFVCWGRGNRKHPRNWNTGRKVYDISLILFLDLFVYVGFLAEATGN